MARSNYKHNCDRITGNNEKCPYSKKNIHRNINDMISSFTFINVLLNIELCNYKIYNYIKSLHLKPLDEARIYIQSTIRIRMSKRAKIFKMDNAITWKHTNKHFESIEKKRTNDNQTYISNIVPFINSNNYKHRLHNANYNIFQFLKIVKDKTFRNNKHIYNYK